MALRTRLVWTDAQIPASVISLLLFFACVLAVIVLFTSIVSGSEDPGWIMRTVIVFVGSSIWFCVMNSTPLRALFAAGTAASQMKKGVFPRDYFEAQVLCVQEDKMIFFRSQSRFDTLYRRFYRIKQDEDGVYILLKDKTALVIPDSAFASAVQKDEVVQFIKRKMSWGISSVR
jgi:hypothetical protein